jgi:hypothetical protein
MNRSLQEFPPGQYLISLSPVQLRNLLGAAPAAIISHHCCRISLTNFRQLELWVMQLGMSDYVVQYVEYPADWSPFTVEATYYENGQPYTQTVLALDADYARLVVESVAYFQCVGALKLGEQVGRNLDIESVTPGYGGLVVRANANRYPEEVVYLAAWVLMDPLYTSVFVAEDGPYGEETYRQGVERVSAAAVAFLNEMNPVEADGIDDADAGRFATEFWAQQKASQQPRFSYRLDVDGETKLEDIPEALARAAYAHFDTSGRDVRLYLRPVKCSDPQEWETIEWNYDLDK